MRPDGDSRCEVEWMKMVMRESGVFRLIKILGKHGKEANVMGCGDPAFIMANGANNGAMGEAVACSKGMGWDLLETTCYQEGY